MNAGETIVLLIGVGLVAVIFFTVVLICRERL